jgi:thioredoxin reductase (NADPH)
MLGGVLNPAEIAAIPLFEALPETERERLCRVAADISVLPGEYVISEGDERALHAVIAGHFEVVKIFDGIPRVIGNRHAGDIFGEVPITLGSPFPAGYRAVEPSRVMRIEAEDYYRTAAAVPDIAVKVGEIARTRLGGLQSITAEPAPPRATVVGQQYDACCMHVRQFLDRNELSFEWEPREEGPTEIRITDGPTIENPTLRQVAEALDLQTQPGREKYDTVVIGGGPAGLAAAVYGASEGLHTIVVERIAPGGQAGTSSRIENYLGFPSGVSGDELGRRAHQQAKRLGAEILVTRTITGIDPETRTVSLDGDDVLRTRTIVVATGVTWRHLPIEDFERLVGKGIHYGAVRSEAPATHGLDVHIVGAGNSAGQAALFFAGHARRVTILCRSETVAKSMSQYLIEQIETKPNIEIAVQAEVTAVHGDVCLEAIDVTYGATGETARLESGGLFIFIGADADTGWLPDEIALDDRGYVLTGPAVRASGGWTLNRDPFLLETSIPGVFACGDVRSSPIKRVAAAVGDGSMAIAFVHQYLQEPS